MLQISQMGERRFENPQTMNLQTVLAACTNIHQLLADRDRERQGEEESRPGMVRCYAERERPRE